MNSSNIEEQEIVHALEDSGMELEMIEQFMENFCSGQWNKGKRILSSYRSKVLSYIHAEQDKLYCMDYLTRKLNQTKTLNCKGNTD